VSSGWTRRLWSTPIWYASPTSHTHIDTNRAYRSPTRLPAAPAPGTAPSSSPATRRFSTSSASSPTSSRASPSPTTTTRPSPSPKCTTPPPTVTTSPSRLALPLPSFTSL
jgi:hypothetical protein